MLFNSLSFLFFLPLVLTLYWSAANKSLRAQNGLLLVASYFFYACWDWRFLFLLIFSTLLDYVTGIKISASVGRQKKLWLWTSIGINLGFLGVFKYYNFFSETLASALSQIGFKADLGTLRVILPVGISFYTFHGLSYVIDLYKNRINPEKNILNYALFVGFFPLLVAGPIERATHLLPQIIKKREFNYSESVDGLKQILWGFFKKIVIADHCAGIVNSIFRDSSYYSGSVLVLGAVFFALQIYCDFSGYSDIALGTARLFGIDLLRNFAFPYFSRDIAEFWRRWHISLSSWFKDYVYIPLGGSRGGTSQKIVNTMVIFLLSGFWHGANWTFVIWGLLNAVYIMPFILFGTHRKNMDAVAKGRAFPSIREALSMVVTFALTTFAWIFFRSDSIGHALRYISGIISFSLFSWPNFHDIDGVGSVAMVIPIFLLIEWFGREQEYAIARLGMNWPMPLRWGLYYGMLSVIFFFSGRDQQFIYFQF